MRWEQAGPGTPFRVLLRHADAGVRSQRRGADQRRGLTELGERQALAVADVLRGLPVTRILSSPFLRCRQTAVPIATALQLDIESCVELGPDAAPEAVLRLLADASTAAAVLCTHRETLQSLFARIADPGARFPSAAAPSATAPMEMAAAWVVRGSATGPEPLRWDWLGSGVAPGQRPSRVLAR